MWDMKIENIEENYTIEGWKAVVIILGIWLAPAAIVFAIMV